MMLLRRVVIPIFQKEMLRESCDLLLWTKLGVELAAFDSQPGEGEAAAQLSDRMVKHHQDAPQISTPTQRLLADLKILRVPPQSREPESRPINIDTRGVCAPLSWQMNQFPNMKFASCHFWL